MTFIYANASARTWSPQWVVLKTYMFLRIEFLKIFSKGLYVPYKPNPLSLPYCTEIS